MNILCRFRVISFSRCRYSTESPRNIVDLNYISISDSKTDERKCPLLILHGLFGHTGNWSSMSKALHRQLKRKVVTADLRNHGSSPHTDEMDYDLMADDVARLIEKISPKTGCCVLLGHSLGGKVAGHIALSKGHLIEKLIVEDIVPRSTSPIEQTDMAPILNAMKLVRLPKMPLSDCRRLVDTDLRQHGVEDATIRQFLLTNLTEKDDRVAWKMNLKSISRFIYNVHEFPSQDSMLSFSKPALFVFGGNSSFYRGAEDDWYLKKRFSKAVVEVIPQCGHWLHFEKPKEFLHHVSEPSAGHIANVQSMEDAGLNLKALHKQDNKIGAILLSASQAAIYMFNSALEQWEKTSAEGSFFICRRSESPIYTFVILNKLCRENFTEHITNDMETVLQGQQYLLYRKGNDYIRAIWFSNNNECIKCESLMSKLICELNSRNMCANLLSSNKPSANGKTDIVSMLNGAQNKREMNTISSPSRPIAVTSLMQQAGNMIISEKPNGIEAGSSDVKQVRSSTDVLNRLLQGGSNFTKDDPAPLSSSTAPVVTSVNGQPKSISSFPKAHGYPMGNASNLSAGAVFLQTPSSKSEQINASYTDVPQLMRPDDFLTTALPTSDFQLVGSESFSNFDVGQLKHAFLQLISNDSDFTEELRRKICVCSKLHHPREFY